MLKYEATSIAAVLEALGFAPLQVELRIARLLMWQGVLANMKSFDALLGAVFGSIGGMHLVFDNEGGLLETACPWAQVLHSDVLELSPLDCAS